MFHCVLEHNGEDSLLYIAELPGAYTRAASLAQALEKAPAEIAGYLCWAGSACPKNLEVAVIQEVSSGLQIEDADSDVLFDSEKMPLSLAEYNSLKALALKSAEDFLCLYQAVPDKKRSVAAPRTTFYGQIPTTAEEMYLHTKNVNAYYFGEIGIAADNGGTILECRKKGFAELERGPNFLKNAVFEGSYGEKWNLRKVMRRFIWHDRIHGKAMYRMACKAFGDFAVPDIFCFTAQRPSR